MTILKVNFTQQWKKINRQRVLLVGNLLYYQGIPLLTSSYIYYLVLSCIVCFAFVFVEFILLLNIIFILAKSWKYISFRRRSGMWFRTVSFTREPRFSRLFNTEYLEDDNDVNK